MKIATIRRGTTHRLTVPVAAANQTFVSAAEIIEMTLSDSEDSTAYWTKDGTYNNGNIIFEFSQANTLELPFRTVRVQIRALSEDGECDSTGIYEIEMLEALNEEVLAVPTTLGEGEEATYTEEDYNTFNSEEE